MLKLSSIVNWKKAIFTFLKYNKKKTKRFVLMIFFGVLIKTIYSHLETLRNNDIVFLCWPTLRQWISSICSNIKYIQNKASTYTLVNSREKTSRRGPCAKWIQIANRSVDRETRVLPHYTPQSIKVRFKLSS